MHARLLLEDLRLVRVVVLIEAAETLNLCAEANFQRFSNTHQCRLKNMLLVLEAEIKFGQAVLFAELGQEYFMDNCYIDVTTTQSVIAPHR